MTPRLPTVILPGYLASASAYLDMARNLQQQGFPTSVVPIQWYGWVPTIGDRPMTPVLKLLGAAIDTALRTHGTEQVNVVGHSAGGWIARLLLGDQPYASQNWGYRDRVATLMTLGTPHLSQERFTRNNMTFVNSTYPGAFYREHVRYICVAGKTVFGKRSRNFWENFTYRSYELTIGRGECWGDGITPVEAAHLEGAENITLEGVWHSPRANLKWYGSPEVLDSWVQYLS
ncbi:MAG: lipase [Gemmatimonadaceae bacterium]|nr:lipase [Gloeobacterales cyanobacterium ES-bin-141]